MAENNFAGNSIRGNSVRENSIRENYIRENNVRISKGDITRLDCECIVNAANRSLLGGGGVDGAIHRAAGPELLEACKKLGGCQVGEAKITKGYRLNARYIIHTVGPVYSGRESERILLGDCYRNSLNLAKLYDIHSIAFPAISTGAYGYPAGKAAAAALDAVYDWLARNPYYGMEIIMCCYDRQTYDIFERMQRERR